MFVEGVLVRFTPGNRASMHMRYGMVWLRRAYNKLVTFHSIDPGLHSLLSALPRSPSPLGMAK